MEKTIVTLSSKEQTSIYGGDMTATCKSCI